ncbi:ATP synthase subunit g, mitochondrial [Drosophila mojavensis]|uniref:ATP synthase subunit n=2 Tax=mojavensis species complex TaxID=198037 RepID=B4KF50_DROMO|nr:ATP synthase subunit g, mitochondrial [Drosophila mojavensis]XP_017858484.1 PREDICTED: ATP synthase subunit g, mitochondrial [Drosophila arizonae]EDW13033.1 uncharacterized protein Dmoj_GI21888 [Drosophila mojavensis]
MAGLVAKTKALITTAKAQARPMFDEFMRYAKVELAPPTPADFKELRGAAEKAKKAKGGLGKKTVSEVWLGALVSFEVISWFFMGEVIGRRHFVGYKV